MTAHDILLGNTKGTAGLNGRDIEYIIDGDRIGLRLKGDYDYNYTDSLKGNTGETGPRGYTFIPFVDANEETGQILLSWINNGNLNNPEPINIKGPQGTSIQFKWEGTKLGIKKDTDEQYTFVDLQGPGITETELNTKLEEISLKNIITIVEDLPTTGEENKIYLKSKQGGTQTGIGGTTISYALQSDLNATNEALQNLINNTYTKTETNTLTNIITIVDELPETGETNTLYFIKDNENTYNVFAYVNNLWIKLNSETKLSEVSADVEEIIDEKLDEKLSQRNYNVVTELPETGIENTLYFVENN